MSTLEKNDYVKVISILVSTMLEPVTKQYDVPEEEGEERRHYCEAAVYLGSKLRCIMKGDKLTVDEEQMFWTKSTIDGYMGLQEYCSDIKQWRHILPRVLLPKWSSETLANASPPSVHQHFPVKYGHYPCSTKGICTQGRARGHTCCPCRHDHVAIYCCRLFSICWRYSSLPTFQDVFPREISSHLHTHSLQYFRRWLPRWLFI